MDKKKNGKKLLQEFEFMRNTAELKALSTESLQQPLTEARAKRMKLLFEQTYGKR